MADERSQNLCLSLVVLEIQNKLQYLVEKKKRLTRLRPEEYDTIHEIGNTITHPDKAKDHIANYSEKQYTGRGEENYNKSCGPDNIQNEAIINARGKAKNHPRSTKQMP